MSKRAGFALTALLAIVWGAQAQPAPPVSPTPVTNFEYDATGNPTRTTIAPGVGGFGFATTDAYDPLGRRTDRTDARQGVTRFGYNGRQDLTQITDPRNLATSYQRNGLGDMGTLASPDTGAATLSYDAAGNLASRTDSRGAKATYAYDALNRLISVTYSQTGQTSQTFGWAYDQTGTGYANGVGRLTSTTHPLGSTQYTYDPQGRVLTDIQRINATAGANSLRVTRTVSYTYDSAGNVATLTYPSGRIVTIGYVDGLPDSLTLKARSTANAVTLLSQIQWNPFGTPKSWLWQNGTSTVAHTFVTDTSGRLVRSRLGKLLRDITYDAGDRITRYTHYDAGTGAAMAASDQSFGYDELGRLVSVSANGSSWLIGYDANGNRASVTLDGTARTYTTAATSNRLASLANPVRSFGYDNAGNTTSDAGYSATYDVTGRLTQLVTGAVTWNYAYDGLGRRVRKFASSGAASTVIYAYDGAGHLLGEYDSGGGALREYVWLGDTPVAVFTPGATGLSPPLAYYVHADQLNTPQAVLDTSGALRWTWYAEPFASTPANTNPAGKGSFAFSLRMPGQVFDAETGLHYNLWRDYDPSIGRYVQSDPVGLAGGINTYAYADGSPTSGTDPLGLATFQCTRKLDNVPFRVGPLYHQYVCTGNAKDGYSCRGLGPTGSMFDSPGKLEQDAYKPEACEKADDDSQCVERCIAKRFASSVPNYSVDLSRGDNCQTYARSLVGECEASCRARRK